MIDKKDTTTTDKIKTVLKNEGLSWAKLAEIDGSTDRSTLKKKVEGWAVKLNSLFNKIGYEVEIKKIRKG